MTERHSDSRVREDESGLSAARAFDVVAASGIDALSVLHQYTGIQYGSPYSNSLGQIPDATVRATDLDIETRTPSPIGGTGLYTVRVNYARFARRASRTPRPGQKVYQWNIAETAAPVDLDINGYPMVNSQLVPGHLRPDPPPSVSGSRVSLSVRYYVSSINLVGLVSYANTVNSVDWTIGNFGYVTDRQAKCAGIIPEQVQASLWLMTANFEFDANTWDVRFIDRDSQGNNLNGRGRPIAEGLSAGLAANTPSGAIVEPVYAAGGTPIAVNLRYRRLREVNFNVLGL